MQNGLLVYGDISIDIHIRTTYQPKAGQDAKVENIVFTPGGSAANCATVAAQLGVPTVFLGFVGKDHFGKMLKTDLDRFGISTRTLRSIDGDTGITVAINEPMGERTFYSYRGVNSSGELSDVSNEVFKKSKYLHLTGYSFQDENSLHNALALISRAKQEELFVSLDPSYWYSREFHKGHASLLLELSAIFPNQEEARQLSGSEDPEEAARILLGMGPKIVIVKLGPGGCYIASEKESCYLPAMATSKVIDTTGAGDAFCAGFLSGQIMGLNIIEAAKTGNAVSSLVIGHIGGHVGAPTINSLVNSLSESNEIELAQKIMGLTNIPAN